MSTEIYAKDAKGVKTSVELRRRRLCDKYERNWHGDLPQARWLYRDIKFQRQCHQLQQATKPLRQFLNKRNPANAKVEVTFFPDQYATRKSATELSLIELRDKIQRTSKASKAKLPWLKLARFGNKRSDAKCWRWDGNTEAISGVELDYDQKKMSFEDARAVIKQAGLLALLYTSARYQPNEPKWRILLPTSELLFPDADADDRTENLKQIRAKLVAGSPVCLAIFLTKAVSNCRARSTTAASVIIRTIAPKSSAVTTSICAPISMQVRSARVKPTPRLISCLKPLRACNRCMASMGTSPY